MIPPLPSGGLAAWLGLCVRFAMLDRTSRSYVFLLAGYTAAIIGIPSVGAPEAVGASVGVRGTRIPAI